MESNTVVFSKEFLKRYALTASWIVTGAGLFLFIGRPSLWPIVMILAGIGLAILAFRRAGSNAGVFPKSRIITVSITIFGLFVLSLGLVVFSKGVMLLVWLVYFVIAIALAVMSIIELKSANATKVRDQA
jgi:hypothetical protein